MITILNISETKFSYNGIAYFKNFTPFVTGNKVSIVNTYDACISLTNFPTIYSDISVDGVTYGSVAALQNALLPVLFNRTFTQAGSLTAGYIPKATGINTLGNSAIYENSGKIGIGTTTTPYKFNVYDTSDGIVGHFSGGVSNYTLISFKSNEANVYSTSLGSYNSGMLFRTGATDRMYINSSGNIGIGTTLPLNKLHVDNGGIRLSDTTNTNFRGITFGASSTDSTEYAYIKYSPSTGEMRYWANPSGFGGFTSFYSNAAESMRITSLGNVGIGTTSPDNGKLTILKATSRATASSYGISIQSNVNNAYTELLLGADDAVDCGIIQSAAKNINFTGKKLALQPQGGNTGIGGTSPLQTLDVFGVSRISSSAPTQEFYSNVNGDVWGSIKAQVSGTGTGGQLVFSTKRDGNSASDKMIITQGGDVLVGKTSTNYTTVGSQFETSGKTFGVTKDIAGENIFLNRISSSTGNLINFLYNSGSVGTISTNGTTTSYNITSDYRLKQDFKPFNGLDLVSQIKVYDYEWKADNSRMNGVIAHELQEVVPYAVTGEKDAEQMQSVDYSKLVPILVQAIQELKAEIEILKN